MKNECCQKNHQLECQENRELIEKRNISFDDVLFWLRHGGLIDDIAHPNKEKYGHQRIFVLSINDYIYLVPYVESESEIFLKTIIPSRKATKKYLGGKK